MMQQQETIQLPILRDDLSLYRGPRERDGSPTWTLFDPVRNRYFRIGWAEFELLSRWQMKNAEHIIQDINDKTTLHINAEHLESLCRFLTLNSLVKAQGKESRDRFIQQNKMMQKSKLQWLVHNYLFFKIPLFRPDGFLSATMPYVQFFFTTTFFWILGAICFFSFYLISRQWEQFTQTFLYFFSFEGIAFYVAALLLAKIVHELGHAYTSKRYGLRVPTMGVAFLVMWPVLYTDTSDAWKLTSQKQRLFIGLAGMASELIPAVVATFLWSFLPDGPVRSAVFLVATVTWVLTLVINLNPCMKFDGYYLFSDLLNIQNLQDRSFALGKWFLRKTFFRIDEPVPETLPPHLHRILIIYAYATWIYRFFLFLGIALLVYYFFFKVLGIMLMIVELVWFIGRPIGREVMEWWNRREQITWNKNTIIFTGFFVVLFLIFFIPWRSSISVPATLHYEKFKRIFPSVPAQIQEVNVKNKDFVNEGDTLFTMDAPELENNIKLNDLRIESLQWQLSRQASHEEILERSKVIEQELASALTEREGYKRQKEQLLVKAPFNGVFLDMEGSLKKGRWIGERDVLGILVNLDKRIVEAYLTEEDISRLAKGVDGYFEPENVNFSSLDVVIEKIDNANTQVLETFYLASIYGGDIAVNQDKEEGLVPDEAVYRVILNPVDDTLPKIPDQIWRGTVTLYGESQSLAYRLWKVVAAVLIRESGF